MRDLDKEKGNKSVFPGVESEKESGDIEVRGQNLISDDQSDKVIEIDPKHPFTQIAVTKNSTKSGVSNFDDLQQEIQREPMNLRKFLYLVILIMIFIVAFFLMSLILNYLVGYAREELKDVKGGAEDIMTSVEHYNSSVNS